MGKIVITSVFDKISGLLKYDSQIEVDDTELFNVRVVSGDDLEVVPNDNDDFDNFEGEVQGFNETRVKGFQFTEPAEPVEKKKKKRNKKEE